MLLAIPAVKVEVDTVEHIVIVQFPRYRVRRVICSSKLTPREVITCYNHLSF
jgi:hypothetical protein